MRCQLEAKLKAALERHQRPSGPFVGRIRGQKRPAKAPRLPDDYEGDNHEGKIPSLDWLNDES